MEEGALAKELLSDALWARIAPAALGIVSVLIALAVSGIVLLMIGASTTHVRRGEKQMLPLTFLIAALALFVAIERFGPHAL
jgi:uncharacterized RDD family membrane protein YckC